jgi:signal transduction histidine kinase
MFFRRLRELSRTTAFRLSVLFGALFVGFVCLLFGLIYWKTAFYLTRQVDEALRNEAKEFAEIKPETWKEEATNEIGDPRQKRIAAIFSPEGELIVGNLRSFPHDLPVDGAVHEFSDGGAVYYPMDGRQVIRAIARRLPSGQIVILVRNVNELHKFHDLMLKALKGGIALTLALSVAGCVVVSLVSLKRLNAIRRTSAKIMAGDLSERFATRNTDDDFDRLSRVVNAILDELERLIDEVKGTSDNIAHDLRTPLTHLRARLERALVRSRGEDEYKAAIEAGILETDLLLTTFAAMLRISEIEHGKRREGFRTINLEQMVCEVAELYEPLASEKGVSLSVQTDSVPQIEGDRDLLFEAFSNLVDNSVKFTPKGGEILLSLRSEQPGAVFEVADSGPGIPSHSREAIFHRFVRGDKTRLTSGNGLGLSLVAAVARLHSFEVSIADAPVGSLFRVNCWTAARTSNPGHFSL